MMKNQKQRVFLVARKRGVKNEYVRRLLHDFQAPPTYSESPSSSVYHYLDRDGNTVSKAMPNDQRLRDIDVYTADKIVDILVNKNDLVEVMQSQWL